MVHRWVPPIQGTIVLDDQFKQNISDRLKEVQPDGESIMQTRMLKAALENRCGRDKRKLYDRVLHSIAKRISKNEVLKVAGEWGGKQSLPHLAYFATDRNIYSIDSDGTFPMIFNYSKHNKLNLGDFTENKLAEAVESYLNGYLTNYEDIPVAMRRELEKHL